MKKMMEKDAEMTEDVVAYNIIPIDCPSTTNDIVLFPEVNIFCITLIINLTN
jgi:callose synthase